MPTNEDFPKEKQPTSFDKDKLISAKQYVPKQNSFGGFIYAGGTMAFTAGYWALGALKLDVIAYIGCDMVYPKNSQSHFYGTGQADPLRDDITLQSLEAKSARLLAFAKAHDCTMINLTEQDQSRLLFPKIKISDFLNTDQLSKTLKNKEPQLNSKVMDQALEKEKALSYMAPCGRYWKFIKECDPLQLKKLDSLWLETVSN